MAGIQEYRQHQIVGLIAAVSKLTERLKSLEHAGVLTKNRNALQDKPVRRSGYVNWNGTHDSIRNMRWMELQELCDKMHDLRCNGTQDTSFETIIINENRRFPEGEIYVDISSVEVLFECRYNYKQYNGKKKALLTSLKKHMHTRGSFEEMYKLRWVNPTEMYETANRNFRN